MITTRFTFCRISSLQLLFSTDSSPSFSSDVSTLFHRLCNALFYWSYYSNHTNFISSLPILSTNWNKFRTKFLFWYWLILYSKVIKFAYCLLFLTFNLHFRLLKQWCPTVCSCEQWAFKKKLWTTKLLKGINKLIIINIKWF